MIPEFPNFKKLELADKKDVEQITLKYPPYSDFNFTSMWCWDIDEEVRLSILNGNLVVKFRDYLSGEPFYSYIGTNEISDTSAKLLQLANEEGLEMKLKLVPETSITDIDATKFLLEEDRDHFDYILDNSKLINHEGKDLRNHAGFKRRFIEEHGTQLKSEILHLASEGHQQMFMALSELWIMNKAIDNKGTFFDHEYKAMKRIFALTDFAERFFLTGIFKNEQLVAFAIDELLEGDTVLRHFMKGDIAYKGVYSYLLSESARLLMEKGKRYTNIEQDLGLMNLRQSKKSFDPSYYLKKYLLTQTNE